MNDIKYIAIADDHAMFRKGLASLINVFPGYKILFDAENGDALIKAIKPQSLPDIILLDINMPVMDGYSTAAWLKVNYPDIKILALSTMDNESAIIKMVKSGAHGYVLKDAEPDELKLAFNNVINQGFFYNDVITRKVMQSLWMMADEKSTTSIFAKLTEREMEFVKYACSEKSYQQIAKEMFLSERTIDGYRDALFRKLNVTTRVGLVLFAVKNRLINI